MVNLSPSHVHQMHAHSGKLVVECRCISSYLKKKELDRYQCSMGEGRQKAELRVEMTCKRTIDLLGEVLLAKRMTLQEVMARALRLLLGNGHPGKSPMKLNGDKRC